MTSCYFVVLISTRFVYGKKLTAITQYNEFVYFPVLSLQKEKIRSRIEQFMNDEVIPKLTKLQNYVADFILIEKDDTFTVCIKAAEFIISFFDL